jgi:hypothetical protein
MGGRRLPQLGLGFRKGDVEAAFAAARALKQELQGQSRLAGAGSAFQKVDAVAGKTARKNVIQAGDAKPRLRRPFGCHDRPSNTTRQSNTPARKLKSRASIKFRRKWPLSLGRPSAVRVWCRLACQLARWTPQSVLQAFGTTRTFSDVRVTSAMRVSRTSNAHGEQLVF